jgi:hypothetical protein
MGKVAKAEKLKLRASFYNNLATGFVITGSVPYFAFMRRAWDDPVFLSPDGFLKILTSGEVWFLAALGLWVIFLAWLLRRIATRTIQEIEDEILTWVREVEYRLLDKR